MTTLGQWLAETCDLPRRDCELLLSEVAGIDRARVIAFPDQDISADHCCQLDQAAAELRQGKPLAYVLGHQEFWTLDFKVSPAVLIPRPETELLVELVLELAPANAAVLDMGTGSGAIAVSVTHARPDLKVTATDQSMDALQIARSNALVNDVTIKFIHSDWFTSLHGHWQIIVSNPPYIAADDSHLPALIAEPQQALVSGTDGLDALRHIVRYSTEHLEPGGYLVLEHGYDQACAVRELMARAGFSGVRSVKDLAHIERATLGCRA